MRILAGDVGATHCRLGLFELADEHAGRPPGVVAQGDTDAGGPPTAETVVYREYPSGDHEGLDPVLHRFLDDAGVEGGGGPAVDAACLGVPCPLDDGRCRLPNLDWELNQEKTASEIGISNLLFINDFTAVGYGVFEVGGEDLVILQHGEREPRGTRAVVGAGTGLGTAFLTWCGGRYRVHGSEGGHVGYAPCTAEQGRLREFMAARHGRATRERVVSGPGLVDLYRFRVRSEGDPPCRDVEAALEGGEDAASVISSHGMPDAHGAGREHGGGGSDRGDPDADGPDAGGSDPTLPDAACASASRLFLESFGAVAGDVALAYEARGGVYLAGGIAPKIRGSLQGGTFLEAFRDKGRMAELVRSVPLVLVTSPRVGILGSLAVGRTLPGR